MSSGSLIGFNHIRLIMPKMATVVVMSDSSVAICSRLLVY